MIRTNCKSGLLMIPWNCKVLSSCAFSFRKIFIMYLSGPMTKSCLCTTLSFRERKMCSLIWSWTRYKKKTLLFLLRSINKRISMKSIWKWRAYLKIFNIAWTHRHLRNTWRKISARKAINFFQTELFLCRNVVQWRKQNLIDHVTFCR